MSSDRGLKGIILVANPTHYLNALEYVFKNPNVRYSIAVVTEYIPGVDVVDESIGGYEWENKYVLDLRKCEHAPSAWQTWKECFAFLREVCDQVNPNQIVVGNLGDWVFYSFLLKSKWGKRAKVVALDDGIPSINILEKRAKGKYYANYHWPSFRIIAKIFAAFGFVLPLRRPLRDVSFFSLFDIRQKKSSELTVNSYEYIKSKMSHSKAPKKDTVYFVGSHIVDRNLVDKEVFIDSLKKAIKFFEGKEFYYIHHRGESPSLKEGIREVCNTIEFDGPLELVFLKESLPEIISGHFSSALFTLSRIYDRKVLAFLFREDQILGSDIESSEEILRIQRYIVTDPFVNHQNLDAL